jgi:hypothetical protein
MRRGAASCRGVLSSCPGRRRASRALLGALTPSRPGLPNAAGDVHVNTASGVQRAAARVVARMPGAGRTFVTLSGPRPASAPAVSSVRWERTGPGVRCPGDRCPVSSVAVRASGVNLQRQCVPRPLGTDQEVLARGGVTAATGEDGWSRRGRPAVSATALSSARVRAWRSSLAQPVLPARRRPRPQPGRRRRLRAAARRARLADQGSASCARIARQDGGGVARLEAATTLRGHRERPGPSRLVSESL